MTDLDRLLRESLKETGSSYSPPDPVAAQEKFVARRRRHLWQLSGGIAVAAAGLAAVLFFASAVPVNPDEIQPGPMEPAALSILTHFEVGTEPLSIAAGGDRRLWIASREGDSVSRIDLDSGLVDKIDLPGANEIVVDDESVWVSGESGDYLRIDEDMPENVFDGNFVERSDGGQLVDLAVGGHPRGGTWAVDTEGCIWELTTPSGGCNADEDVATDVASDDDETWILASEQGYAWFFDGDPTSQEGRPGQNYSDLPASEYGDMAMTEDTLWVSGGGRIVTVDLETGQRRELEIDGDYADLALGPETVWALAGWADGDQRGRVYEFSPDLEVIGISDVLRGEPSDLVADANGVWITIRHRNEVIYLSRGETTPPVAPLDEEEPAADG